MSTNQLRRSVCLAAFAAMAAWSVPGTAQTWPTGPVRIVVPFPPGGGSDAAARALAEPLTRALGQTVIVENRPGAASAVGTAAVARAAPDGHTLLVFPGDIAAINEAYGVKQAFDPVKDFTLVGGVARLSLVLLARPDIGVRSLQDLVVRARANPGKMSFASLGTSSPHFLFFESFKRAAKVDITAVQYQGTTQAVADLIGGHVDLVLLGEATGLRHVATGKAIAVASTAERRSSFAPDTPTFAEGGFPEQSMYNWFAIATPVGTPRAVVERLNAEINKALKLPEVAQRMATVGMSPWIASPEELDGALRRDISTYSEIIRATGAKPDGR